VLEQGGFGIVCLTHNDPSNRPVAIKRCPVSDLSRTGPYEPATVDEVAAETPEHIGRYRVEKILGQGGFGLVYLAHDGQLQRLVAIKVPHRHRVSTAEDAEAYLTEARTVANLDHPNIVPVHDVGSTEQFPCFVVSKYIDGTDLATRLKQSQLSIHETVELVATVAEALHHAHKQGLVHRDIKPGNILLDKSGKSFVADFGLALREQDVGKGPRYAGTPTYMSPEQARGEGHRVDGRSDIFSLGMVFYELLTGRRPFKGDSQANLMEQITSFEARPPRQYDEGIPRELDRICLKTLSKRASERYSTAKDMADDLRHFFEQSPLEEKEAVRSHDAGSPPAALVSTPLPSPVPTPSSDRLPVKIVPKGLRSFDAQDADFFLALLPGPRDREGLPDNIRFWKARIEEMDADNTFSVGLIYGPSGCGKSSFVKAGLLPRLSDDVIAVYVEATAEETETRLLNCLRKRCPALPDNLGLKETLASLRRGQGIPVGKKVVIVLDQFEQWLHAKKKRDTELVQALRQCDGGRLQCVVMVRDDFWLAVSRFVQELEVDLVPGRNIALVDLFDLDHARKVLTAFGCAFGKLPEKPAEFSKEQKDFLKQAVSGFSQGNKVICVRLALFAEMMKGRPWTLASLKEVGGTEGVGVTFLEETFSSQTANPKHRLHQKAARGVLKALLPESGTDIKGTMRSHAELLEASGYAGRRKDFEELLRILDSEIRLITPTDPEGKEEGSASSLKAGDRYFQLTHDYLVHSLRDWLTRKQKETRRGRAELRLAERASLWNAKPESRHLPAGWEWACIRLFTKRNDWTDSQKKMMRKAGRFHVVRGVALAAVVCAATLVGIQVRNRIAERNNESRAASLVQALLGVDIDQVPGFITQIERYRPWADQLLHEANEKAARDSRQKLNTSLALLPVDPNQKDYLYQRLLNALPSEVRVIRDALVPHKGELVDKLWAVVEGSKEGKESQRLQAAAALANYDPDGDRWGNAGALVVNDLVLENLLFSGQWSEAFRPAKNWLLPRLSEIFRDHQPERSAERSLATNILADYASDNPLLLADLLMEADDKQFSVIHPRFKEQGEQGLPLLIGEIDKKLPPDLPSSDGKREKLAKRQANAAVALLRMDQPEKVWPLLRHGPDPRVRSYLVHRLSPLGANAKAIVRRLEEEPDLTIRRALLLSLGEYGEKDFALEDRKAMLEKLQEIYRTEADPGLHASAEWLLGTWKQEAWLKQTNDDWAKDKEKREKRLEGIQQLVTKDKEKAPPQWYVNGQGQTMVVIPGPVDFVMGSPLTEEDRRGNELPHKRRIPRSFALAATPVTKEHFLRFWPTFRHSEFRRYPSPSCPIGGVGWYEAVAYCNWLSKEEGLPEDQWCYEIKGTQTKLKAHYLSLTGYRLPTEAEMEYATRAGALTSRYFGETEELLQKYAWYFKNSPEQTRPVGTLKPNDLGLFESQGNVYTWCQESYNFYPSRKGDAAVEDREDEFVVKSIDSRVLRGGSFLNLASNVRSANRLYSVPTNRYTDFGFRPARTLPLGSFTALAPTPEGGRK
jgi:serine/threonine protein kinase/formylglycine-generating enzyme required for sulfatase activity